MIAERISCEHRRIIDAARAPQGRKPNFVPPLKRGRAPPFAPGRFSDGGAQQQQRQRRGQPRSAAARRRRWRSARRAVRPPRTRGWVESTQRDLDAIAAASAAAPAAELPYDIWDVFASALAAPRSPTKGRLAASLLNEVIKPSHARATQAAEHPQIPAALTVRALEAAVAAAGGGGGGLSFAGDQGTHLYAMISFAMPLAQALPVGSCAMLGIVPAAVMAVGRGFSRDRRAAAPVGSEQHRCAGAALVLLNALVERGAAAAAAAVAAAPALWRAVARMYEEPPATEAGMSAAGHLSMLLLVIIGHPEAALACFGGLAGEPLLLAGMVHRLAAEGGASFIHSSALSLLTSGVASGAVALFALSVFAPHGMQQC